MKIYEIKNNILSFRSGDLCGEHVSLRFHGDDTEYIWQPRPGHWEHGSFICFPLLGRVPDGKYELDGCEYEMPMHGFVQHRNFTVLEHCCDSICYELRSDSETRAMYPFDFRLRARYTLTGGTLEVRYEVENLSGADMPFSIGGHPGFTCPLAEGEEFSDYFLEFEKEESIENVVTFYSPKEVLEDAFGKHGRVLPLDYKLFKDGSICFHPVNSSYVSLKNKKSELGVKLALGDADYFQIWTAPGSPFLCMEAWHGAITRWSKPGQNIWRNREGTITIKPGEVYSYAYYVTLLR